MASNLNSEFNYRYQVIGSTPWEKLKTLKGFLEGRKRAAALEKVAELKHKAKLDNLRTSLTTRFIVKEAPDYIDEYNNHNIVSSYGWCCWY